LLCSYILELIKFCVLIDMKTKHWSEDELPPLIYLGFLGSLALTAGDPKICVWRSLIGRWSCDQACYCIYNISLGRWHSRKTLDVVTTYCHTDGVTVLKLFSDGHIDQYTIATCDFWQEILIAVDPLLFYMEVSFSSATSVRVHIGYRGALLRSLVHEILNPTTDNCPTAHPLQTRFYWAFFYMLDSLAQATICLAPLLQRRATEQ
jgi:hypothetical protein